jgi:hypothetical protein
MLRWKLQGLAVAAIAMLAIAPAMTAQEDTSTLDAAKAKAFIGDWVMTGQNGPRSQTERSLSIKDVGGKLVAEVAGGRGGGPYAVDDISMRDATLVLKFTEISSSVNVGVSMEPTEITLTPGEGDSLVATLAAGTSYYQGKATRRK